MQFMFPYFDLQGSESV